jgi:hypothetical protein
MGHDITNASRFRASALFQMRGKAVLAVVGASRIGDDNGRSGAD